MLVQGTPDRSAQRALQALLGEAGVRTDGEHPWDLRVHNPRFYRRVLAGGSLALGESYMDGWWDCPSLDQFFCRVLRAQLDRSPNVRTWRIAWNRLRARLLNLQSRRRARAIGERHYDRGNDLFEQMLGPCMVYSCAYWKGADTLEAAQEAKLDLVCRKIGVRAGMRVLDIGCGWGSFAKHAAERYGATVVGITVSEEQVTWGRAYCRGLPVELRLQDYRAVDEVFDRIVSIGMFEHVGVKNYAAYMDVARRCLRPDGLFLLHTIGRNRSGRVVDPWINKYIFPNGNVPSARQICEAVEERFVLEDWHNFGTHYDPTLMAWHDNFVAGWDALRGAYDERFYRMWRYYLLASAGTFRARRNQVWQLVLSPHGVEGGYESVR